MSNLLFFRCGFITTLLFSAILNPLKITAQERDNHHPADQYIFADLISPKDGSFIGNESIPKLTTSINGVVVMANNDGKDDHGAFTVTNKKNNIVCNFFKDQNGIKDPLLKVYQTYTADNVNVPYCNKCAASMSAFKGAVATAALINPASGGKLILRFRSWIDKNKNGVIDQTEPASDWIVYTITCSAAVIPKLTTSINGVVVKANNDGTDDHGSFAVNNKPNNIICNSFTD
jgi:hypothetical protein